MEPRIQLSYTHTCLCKARRLLMVPIGDEAEAIAAALHECSLALEHLPEDLIDDSARQDVATIRAALTTGPEHDDPARGAWHYKARGMAIDEKYELSRAIDELAHWSSF